MNEEEAVKNDTPKIEKKIKSKSRKGEKNEETAMETQETQNISAVEAIQHVQISGKEDIIEMKRDKKKLKKKKNKVGKVAEADIKKDSEEGDLTVAYGEDGSGDAFVNVEKKRKKREKNMDRDDNLDGESISEIKSIEDANKERKKPNVKRKHEDGNIEGEKDGKEFGQHSLDCKVCATKVVERKKRKKEKKKNKDVNQCEDTFGDAKHDEGDLPSVQQENVRHNVEGNIESTKPDGHATKEHERKKKKKKNKEHNVDNDTDEMQSNEVEYASKNGKKYTLIMETSSDDLQDNGVEFKETKSVGKVSSDVTPNKSNKKVKFSGQVEIFPLPGDSNTAKENAEEVNLVRGKRFTCEEDKVVKEAVFNYVDKRNLGDEGLDMVLNCKKHPEVKGCWKEIASAIPYRPYTAVYYRAQMLFRRSENRNWTQDYEKILKYQEEHGNKWKALAEELGRYRFHVKDTWRRIKLRDRKKGPLSQKEYQKLFDLVNIDLQAKLSEEKRSKHGMLRDNICWTAISDELSTRSQTNCCVKWYKQLTSSMVAEGIWADTDDYRLLDALYSLDATCMEDVDWDSLVEHRPGDVCRKRWNQMVLHIGRHGNKSFAEQVEVLAQRYCPNLLEARETWDRKPRVP